MKAKTPIEWLLSGDTGISSKTICCVMTGSEWGEGHFGPDVPYDPSDFGRCYRLLALFPDWKPRLKEVADKYPIWGPLVSAWDELTALYEKELPKGSAPILYHRMKALIDEGRIAAGWKRNGACWQSPPPPDEDAEPEDDTEDEICCPACNGSGEGMTDGSTCSSCKGRGELSAR